MRINFTEGQIEAGLNVLELEDILFTAVFIEGEGRKYRMTGNAVVDGEVYRDFVVEFETETEPGVNADAKTLLSLDWLWYDYLFEA